MPTATKKTANKRRFRILAGTHTHPHPTKKGPNGKKLFVRYEKGDVIEVDGLDLTFLNPANPNLKNKYEEVGPEVRTKIELEEEKERRGTTLRKRKKSSSTSSPKTQADVAREKMAAASSSQKDDLEAMSVKELQAFAEENEIDLGDTDDKELMLELIREGSAG